MKKLHPFRIIYSLLIVLSLFLSSCGATDEEYSDAETTEEPTTEESVTEEPATQEAGSESAPTSAPGEVVYDFGFTPEQNGFNFQNYGDDIPVGKFN